ncbi:MAG: MFS transporter [Pseudomonadota bacterium]
MNTTSNTPPAPSSQRARTIAIALLLVGAVCGGMGQTIVFSVLPPLAREMGLSNFQVGCIFALSASFWMTFGPRWGRASDARGRKPFILIGVSGFAVSMFAFGGVIKLGLAGLLAGAPLYALLLFTRGVHGVFGSANPPAAQAYIADRTDAEGRTAGLSQFSAAFGLGAMLGPGFGAAAAAIGPATPFFAIGVFAAVMGVAVYRFLPERTGPVRRVKRPSVRLADPRLRPFLIYGVCLGIINSIPLQTIGFYFLDRLQVPTDVASQVVGVGLMGGAMASLFSQLVIVQRFRLEPRLLMRIAPVLFVAGHALIWLSADLGPVIFGMTLSGFASGLAIPGYSAGASLSVTADEQGSAMGLASAAGASGFIVSPLAAFWLYGMSPQAPYIFSTTLAIFVGLFALKSRRIGAASPKTDAEPPESNDPASAPYQ